MIAEDYTESLASASAIYSIIRQRMLNTTNRDNILPIVYLIDSILKNVKGCFVALLEKDAIEWMPTVYQKLNEIQRVKLEKVWKTWNEFKIFSLDSWRAMGKCFAERVSGSSAAVSSFTAVTEITGITRTVRILTLFSSQHSSNLQITNFSFLFLLCVAMSKVITSLPLTIGPNQPSTVSFLRNRTMAHLFFRQTFVRKCKVSSMNSKVECKMNWKRFR